jgi:capsular polysaccharide transport system permease protein
MTDVRQAGLSDLVTPAAARAGGALAPAGGRGLRAFPGGGPLGPVGRFLGARRPAVRLRPLLMLLLCFSPTLLTGGYFGLIASDRYLSTASFVVRTASKPIGGGAGLGAILKMAGLGRSEDDTYSVQNFLTSRDAVRQLQERLPLMEMYGRAGIDPLSAFPSPIYRRTQEDLFRYFTRMTSVSYNATTGITTLEVQGFRPDDAQAIATTLLDLAEQLVNRLNARIHTDAVQAAEEEVKRQEERLTQAQIAVTAFQSKETVIDPATSGLQLNQLVGKLQADLAQTQARIADMTASAPNNPGLIALQRQADVTRAQIAKEQARVSSNDEGLADKLGTYQRLVLEREFATKALGLADTALDSARNDARRKQLYIERIVEPNKADRALLPLRLWTTTTVLLVNILALFLGWMISAGLREHLKTTR